jgi:hypothetical protein
LLAEKLLDAGLFDFLQVFNETVAVTGAVAIIKSLQPAAGKVDALKAKSYLSGA